MKKKSILLLLPFAAMALAGCGEQPTPPADPCESAVVQLNKTTLSLEVGASETLTASMSVEGCDLGEVTWSSDHEEIAKVENGKVTAVAVGTAKITANGAECVVTVTAQPGPVVKHVEDIRIEPNLYPSMKVGDPDYQINFTVLPEDAENKAVTFSCDTPAVATVSDAGVIHAVAAGTAKITVTSIDNAEVSKVLNLTVTAADVSMPDTTIAGYEKVMSGELVDGSLVEFISQTNGVIYGMKNYDSGNNIKASQCSVDNGVVVEGSDVALYTVEKNDDGSFSFKDSNNKYLAASVGSSNKLTAKNSKDDTCKFSVTITNGLASIVCNAQGVERGTLCLNYNNGSPLFNCYASLGKYSSITFFAKEAGEQKEIKSIELKVSDSYDKEYLDTDSWSVVGLTVEATYTDDTKGAVDPRAYDLIFAPEAPALGVTSVSVKAKMFAGSEIESPAVVIEGITVSHNEEGVRVTGITVTDAYPKMKVGDPDKQIEVTVLPENATNKEVTFVSDNTAVATVTDAGVIHAVAPGKANITVASVDVPTVTKKVEVTVTAADIVVPSVTSDEYTKVVSGELTNGSQVEFIAQTNGKVYGMKKYDSGNNIKGAECAIGEESIIIDEAVEHYFVEKNDDNTYSFKDSAGNYIYAAGGTSSNYLKAKAEKGETSKFNVTIANGVASIICAAETTTRNVLALNYNNGTPLFSCYAALGTYSPITLYEKVPEPAKLVSITADMTKKTYTEGDPLDLTGLVVTGHYDDETEVAITEGYTLSMEEGHILAISDEALVITYEEKTCSIALSVREASATLESINITGAKTSYYAGETLGEITVTAVYSDTTRVDVTEDAELKIGENDVDGDHVMALGEEQLTASYEGKTATADFVVLEDSVVSIAVSEEHRTFELGAEFVKETVTATYASGKTEDVTEDSEFTGYDKETAGEQTITVTYGTLEPITYLITVSAPAPIVAEGTYVIKHTRGEVTYYMSAEVGTNNQPKATTEESEAVAFDFELKEETLDTYTIKIHGENKYLALGAKDNNGVRYTTSAFEWKITNGTLASGAFDLSGVISGETRYLTLYVNGTTLDFRCYTSASASNRKENTDLQSVVVKDVESIAIKQNPTKMTYYVGEAFDPTGMIVTVTYTDTTTEDITEGFTYEGSTGFQAANPDRTVKVTYKTKNAYVQHVEVKEDDRTITAIKFAEGCDMTKKEYEVGDDWDPKGLKVIAVRSDDSEFELADADVTFTYDKTTEAAAESMTLNVTAHYVVDDSTTLDSAAKAISVVVKAKEEVEGSLYTFDPAKKTTSAIDGTKFMQALVLEDGDEIITGASNVSNTYIGANGGSGDTAWALEGCLKLGKSSGGYGSVTLALDSTISFTKVKVCVLGWADTCKLKVGDIEKEFSNKAAKGNLTPVELEFNISSGESSLTIQSVYSSGNLAVLVTSIQFC